MQLVLQCKAKSEKIYSDMLKFTELTELKTLAEKAGGHARVKIVAEVPYRSESFPLYRFAFGSDNPEAPTLGLFAGVHGLEQIGTKVVTSYLRTLLHLKEWDKSVQVMLQKVRIVFMPLINPVGMLTENRSNGNGVDLMRNAPVEAEGIKRWFLPAGHRYSPRLPWYRGKLDGGMEIEAEAVCKVVREELFTSKLALSLDVHSGYGVVDRLWFPYAKTKKPFPQLAQVFALKRLMDETYPHHIYRIEPQSHQYTTHGDLWDYLYDQHRTEYADRLFLPLSLEMGSWQWVKKNPKQLFSLLGAFNPLLPHRSKRILRRHLTLFDFLGRAVQSSESWVKLAETSHDALVKEAMDYWYGKAH